MKLFPRSLLFFCLFNCFFAVKNLACPSLAKKLLFFTTLLLADQAKTQANPSVHDCYPTNHSLTENLQFFDDCASTGRCENVRPDVAACLKHPIYCSQKHLNLLNCAQGYTCQPFLELKNLLDRLTPLWKLYEQLGFSTKSASVSGSEFIFSCEEGSLVGAEIINRFHFSQQSILDARIYGTHSSSSFIKFIHVANLSVLIEEFFLLHELAHYLLGDTLMKESEQISNLLKFVAIKYPMTTKLIVDAKVYFVQDYLSQFSFTNVKHPIAFFNRNKSNLLISNYSHSKEFLADGLAFVALYLKYGNINFEPLFKNLARIFDPAACKTHPSKDDRIAFLRQVLLSLQKEDLSSN